MVQRWPRAGLPMIVPQVLRWRWFSGGRVPGCQVAWLPGCRVAGDRAAGGAMEHGIPAIGLPKGVDDTSARMTRNPGEVAGIVVCTGNDA